MVKQKRTTVAYGAFYDWAERAKHHERERLLPFEEKLRLLDALLSPMPSLKELQEQRSERIPGQ